MATASRNIGAFRFVVGNQVTVLVQQGRGFVLAATEEPYVSTGYIWSLEDDEGYAQFDGAEEFLGAVTSSLHPSVLVAWTNRNRVIALHVSVTEEEGTTMTRRGAFVLSKDDTIVTLVDGALPQGLVSSAMQAVFVGQTASTLRSGKVSCFSVGHAATSPNRFGNWELISVPLICTSFEDLASLDSPLNQSERMRFFGCRFEESPGDGKLRGKLWRTFSEQRVVHAPIAIEHDSDEDDDDSVHSRETPLQSKAVSLGIVCIEDMEMCGTIPANRRVCIVGEGRPTLVAPLMDRTGDSLSNCTWNYDVRMEEEAALLPHELIGSISAGNYVFSFFTSQIVAVDTTSGATASGIWRQQNAVPFNPPPSATKVIHVASQANSFVFFANGKNELIEVSVLPGNHQLGITSVPFVDFASTRLLGSELWNGCAALPTNTTGEALLFGTNSASTTVLRFFSSGASVPAHDLDFVERCPTMEVCGLSVMASSGLNPMQVTVTNSANRDASPQSSLHCAYRGYTTQTVAEAELASGFQSLFICKEKVFVAGVGAANAETMVFAVEAADDEIGMHQVDSGLDRAGLSGVVEHADGVAVLYADDAIGVLRDDGIHVRHNLPPVDPHSKGTLISCSESDKDTATKICILRSWTVGRVAFDVVDTSSGTLLSVEELLDIGFNADFHACCIGGCQRRDDDLFVSAAVVFGDGGSLALAVVSLRVASSGLDVHVVGKSRIDASAQPVSCGMLQHSTHGNVVVGMSDGTLRKASVSPDGVNFDEECGFIRNAPVQHLRPATDLLTGVCGGSAFTIDADGELLLYHSDSLHAAADVGVTSVGGDLLVISLTTSGSLVISTVSSSTAPVLGSPRVLPLGVASIPSHHRAQGISRRPQLQIIDVKPLDIGAEWTGVSCVLAMVTGARRLSIDRNQRNVKSLVGLVSHTGKGAKPGALQIVPINELEESVIIGVDQKSKPFETKPMLLAAVSNIASCHDTGDLLMAAAGNVGCLLIAFRRSPDTETGIEGRVVGSWAPTAPSLTLAKRCATEVFCATALLPTESGLCIAAASQRRVVLLALNDQSGSEAAAAQQHERHLTVRQVWDDAMTIAPFARGVPISISSVAAESDSAGAFLQVSTARGETTKLKIDAEAK